MLFWMIFQSNVSAHNKYSQSCIASSKGWSVDAIEYSLECVKSLSYALPQESTIHQGSL